MVLVPNEDYWDRKHVHLNRVNISMAPATDAQTQIRYETGKLDIATLGDPAEFEKDPALSPAVTRLEQFSVLFLTLIPSRNPALEDVRVREAIALAIGRSAVAKVGVRPKPSTSLVPSTLHGFDASVGFRGNVARARQLLAAAGYPGGRGFPTFSIMTSHDDPYVQAVVDSLQKNLGIKAVQDVVDPGVENAKEHEVQPASFVGYFSTGYTGILTWRRWVSNLYPPSQTELLSLKPDDYTHYEVLQAKGTARSLAAAANFLDAHASPESRQFAAAAAKADATANPDRATALYKQAAAMRQGTYEFIPYCVRPHRLCDPSRHQRRPPVDRVLHDFIQGRQSLMKILQYSTALSAARDLCGSFADTPRINGRASIRGRRPYVTWPSSLVSSIPS